MKTKSRQRSASQTISASAASALNTDLTPSLAPIIQPRVMDRWKGLIQRDYTVEQVKQTLAGAWRGNRLYQSFALYDMMEECSPRITKDLNQIRRSVSTCKVKVNAFAEQGQKPTPMAQEKAKFVERCLWRMKDNALTGQCGLGDTIYNIMDAYGKGISVNEVYWKRLQGGVDDGAIVPTGTGFVRSIYYDYPLNQTSTEKLMLDPSGNSAFSGEMQDFPEHKFIIATYRTTSATNAARFGLLRCLAPWWVYANFSTEWILQYGQIFGVPIRWATYTRSADKDILSEMLENMGSGGWGAFPAGTDMKLVEGSQSANGNPNIWVIDHFDTLCDLVLLNQTLTSEVSSAGGNRALGEVHERILSDKEIECATWAFDALANSIVRSLIVLNYGNEDEIPFLVPDLGQKASTLAMAQTDKVLFVDMGIPVSKEYLYERHGITAPAQDADLFVPPAAPASPFGSFGASAPQPATLPAPRPTLGLSALEGMNVPSDVVSALEAMPDDLRSRHIEELISAARYEGGQPGGGRFMAGKVDAAKAKVQAIMANQPHAGGRHGMRAITAFGLPDNSVEASAWNATDQIPSFIDAQKTKVKTTTPLKIADLKTTQAQLDGDKIMAMLASSDNGTEPTHKAPIVVKINGQDWLWDGHHRAAKELALGNDTINARVVDWNKDGGKW